MASYQAGSSNAGPSNMQEEFTVRIPRDSRKVFTMMKFGTASNVDFAKMGEQPVKIERENNLKEYKSANDIDLLPKFGAGSEYGRELKEESRRKKYGIMLKKYNPDDQPWLLKLGAGKQGKRYKGIREGTIAENTSYYIFTKAADGAFEAFPVGEWYNFTPVVKYKYLNSEEAEEEFTRRDKTLNYFNIMLKKRLRKDEENDFDDDDDEDGKGKKKKGKKKSSKSKNMILTDMEEWNDLHLTDDDDDENDDDDDDNGAPKKKNTKGKKNKKTPKNSKKNSDDEAIEESDEGDYDDREVDYISDSGSSDSLSGPEKDDKDKNQEKGVDEEKGLRNILDSDAEDEEEEEKEEVEEEIEEKEDKKEDKAKKGDDSSSSSSDDDSDIEKNMSSAIFMQREKNGKADKKDNVETNRVDAGEPSSSGLDKKDKGLKRKVEKSPDGKAVPSKKHKSDDSEGITEDAIRRYLTRKPMTTKDLLQKFRSKKLNMTNVKLTHTIAQLLKKLNPERTTINKKLYLSLKKPE